MSKRVAVLQSCYLPWKGYFDLIHDVDLFIFYDDVQYTNRDWRNRNRIKTDQGLRWLTIPVGADQSRRICDVLLQTPGWEDKHWRLLQRYYRAAPAFAQYSEFFADALAPNRWRTLSELNHHLIVRIARDLLGVTTSFEDSRGYELRGRKQERLLELLQRCQATTYVSGPAARAYIDPQRFVDAGIELIWKDYSGYPEYRQFYPPFEHRVSIVDLLFHAGDAAPDLIWGWRTR